MDPPAKASAILMDLYKRHPMFFLEAGEVASLVAHIFMRCCLDLKVLNFGEKYES